MEKEQNVQGNTSLQDGLPLDEEKTEDITEQPYEKTARIPVLTPELSRQRAIRVTRKRRITPKKHRISPRRPRITPPMPSLRQVRFR